MTLLRPDDWHLHLRDGAAMADVVAHSARCFSRAIIMPNLRPPVTTTDAALAYRERILAARPTGSTLTPLMTLYLTDETSADEIARAARSPHVAAVKLYPAGATTHSDAGVTDLDRVTGALEAMQRHSLPLLVHGEVTDPAVDIFDREAVFIDRVLAPLVARFEGLRVVLEHVTTQDGVDFVDAAPDRVAGTITPHHLLLSRNALLAGGLRPHHYCLPVLKHERHRRALVEAATSGHPRLFLGTDSAPHPLSGKEAPCGCAGIFSAHAAIELYAEVFDAAGALDHLEAFTSRNGPAFYGLPVNQDRVTLVREQWAVPASYPFADDVVVPLRAGETVHWRAVPKGATI